MIFLVSLETPGLGSRTVCFVEAEDKKSAQKEVVKIFVSVGVPIETIGQVTDWVTLEIGINKITIVPVPEMNQKIVSALTALL